MQEEHALCSKGVTKEEWACILGIHRTTLFEVVSYLKRAGVLGDVGRKRLIIHDYNRLVKIAEGLKV